MVFRIKPSDTVTRPCVGCGYCCRTAICCVGQKVYGVGPAEKCPGLASQPDGTFRCPVAEQYREELAIGAGCCSPMFNEDRQAVIDNKTRHDMVKREV